MLKIGLTGNAGSGKSLALAFFRARGENGISLDEINTELRQHCKFLTIILETILNTNLSDLGGLIDQTLLRKILFSSQAAKTTVEAVLHPLIIENLDLQIALSPSKNYCIIEIPLLFEAKMQANVDSVLLVTANKQELVNRISRRNNIEKKNAQTILNSQLADNNKFILSDDIVLNNETQAVFQKRLGKLLNRKF